MRCKATLYRQLLVKETPATHLGQFALACIPAHHHIAGPLADGSSHFPSIFLYQGLRLSPLQGLQDASDDESQALQAVLCPLQENLNGSQCSEVGEYVEWEDWSTSGISFDPSARGPSRFR